MRLAALVLLLATTTALPAYAADERQFTGEDLFKLEAAADPQISPDGKTIAYVRRSADVMNDRIRGAIWLIDVASGQQRPLITGPGSYGAPRWSPDGSRLAYISGDEGGAQLWVRWISSSASARVTQLPDAPQTIAWSPDGKALAYVMRVPGDGPSLGKAPARPEGAKWADPLEIYDRATYRADDGGYVRPGFSHLFLVPADGGAPRQLTFGDFDDGGPLAWAPDGKSILFSAIRKPNWENEFNDSEVYTLDLASGGVTALTSRYGPDQVMAVSPDGRQIAYLGYDDTHRTYENAELYVMNRDGSGAHSLTAGQDIGIDDAKWSPDSKSLIVQYDSKGAASLGRVGLDGSFRQVVSGLSSPSYDRPYTGGSFSLSGTGAIAYSGGNAARPPEVKVLKGAAPQQLTHLNGWLDGKALAAVEKVAVTAPDGRAIDAWLVTPRGRKAGEKVPLVLEIHGGPHAAYGPWFSTDYQLYAAAGYAVLYTNPRGSTSYGEAFAKLIDRAYPGEDYNDLMASVDAAIAAGVADPDNLFVTGGSGGGILTAWIVGKTTRFRAAVSQKPVINWVSEALTMDNTGFTSRYWFDQPPWVDVTPYWKRSPLSLVDKVKTPTMVVVGSEDYRTPVSESEQYYAALKIAGVPTALVKIPGASHGGIAARPSQAAAKASAIIAWFERYRKKPGEAAKGP